MLIRIYTNFDNKRIRIVYHIKLDPTFSFVNSIIETD
jgi:hypothetical protein